MGLPPQRSLIIGIKAYTILENIPPDRFITSKKISEKTPYNVREISACIRSKLLYTYVIREKGKSGYKYKRLPMTGPR